MRKHLTDVAGPGADTDAGTNPDADPDADANADADAHTNSDTNTLAIAQSGIIGREHHH